MSDYGHPSQHTIEVATEAIREDAKKWYGLSDRIEKVRQITDSLDLELPAFMVIEPNTGGITAADLKSAYDRMHGQLTTLFKQATTEFELFGAAMRRAADSYERSDTDSEVNLKQIWAGK